MVLSSSPFSFFFSPSTRTCCDHEHPIKTQSHTFFDFFYFRPIFDNLFNNKKKDDRRWEISPQWKKVVWGEGIDRRDREGLVAGWTRTLTVFSAVLRFTIGPSREAPLSNLTNFVQKKGIGRHRTSLLWLIPPIDWLALFLSCAWRRAHLLVSASITMATAMICFADQELPLPPLCQQKPTLVSIIKVSVCFDPIILSPLWALRQD